MKQRRSAQAFVYRAGIGLRGTPITCDGPGFANDLIFLSHAYALAPHRSTALTGPRAGRRQVVTTETTLRLLGNIGDKLKGRTLPAAFGRPFNLGGHRIEVVPTGYLPGSAALLCESDGRRLFYVGAFCPESPVPGIESCEVRNADAMCVDASLGDPERHLPPRSESLAKVRTFVGETLQARKTPVLLGAAQGALAWVATELVRAGFALRAHARVHSALARLHAVTGAVPAVARFSSKLSEGEALLWPMEARAKLPSKLPSGFPARLALVSGTAADPGLCESMQVAAGFPLTTLPSFTEILALIEASAAREVALFHGPAESVAKLLRQRGLDAYPVGPPRQMTLPGA